MKNECIISSEWLKNNKIKNIYFMPNVVKKVNKTIKLTFLEFLSLFMKYSRYQIILKVKKYFCIDIYKLFFSANSYVLEWYSL